MYKMHIVVAKFNPHNNSTICSYYNCEEMDEAIQDWKGYNDCGNQGFSAAIYTDLTI